MITSKYFKKLSCIDEWSKNQLSLKENITSPIYCGDSDERMISIMINVAWGNAYLLELLNVLEEHNVKATFFLDGSWLHKYPLLGKKIFSNGHDIGNHAYSHPDMRGLTMEKIQWQLRKTNEIIEKELGVKSKLFTPPSGEFDERVVYVASQEGMITVLSTIDTLDWQNPNPKDLIEKIRVSLKNGAMILIHPTKSALLALPGIIQTIKESNYMITTVTNLLRNTLETNLVDTEQGTIYVDGQPIEVDYILKDDDLLVPAYFFKNVGLEVTYNFEKSTVILNSSNQTEILYSTNNIYLSLQKVTQVFGINIFYDSETLRIYLITNTSPHLKPEILFKGNILENKVALTFDDGPDDYNTPQVLDILKAKSVKATFFIVGEQASIFPELLKRIVKEGHSIGNHTWSHPNLAKLSTPEVIKEIKKTQEIVQSITGLTPILFRPPFGSITSSDVGIIDNLGFKIINWNIDTLDYEGTCVEEIMNIVQTEISPGSIILQHTFQNSTGLLDGSIDALPLIIDALQSSGMEFVKLEELIN